MDSKTISKTMEKIIIWLLVIFFIILIIIAVGNSLQEYSDLEKCDNIITQKHYVNSCQDHICAGIDPENGRFFDVKEICMDNKKN